MKTAFKLSILVISAIHLVRPVLPFDPTYLLFAAVIVSLITGMSLMSGTFRIASVVFLAAGSAALVYSGSSPYDWAKAFDSMTNIIAIIVVMQLFALPLALGGYQESILRWVRGTFKHERSLFLFTTGLVHILASFLSFGSVPVAITLLEKTLKNTVERFDRFTATAVSRGYALTALWAPGAINIFLVLQATGISWSALFVPGLLLGMIGISLSYLLDAAGKRGADIESAAPAEQPVCGGGSRKPAPASHVFMVTAAFLAVVFIMEKASFGAVYNRIIFAGALVSFGWIALLMGGGRACGTADLKNVFADHWKAGLLKAGDLAPFFIAMGAFSGGFEQSGVMEAVSPVLSSAAVAAGPAVLVAVPVLLVLLGLLGIHPFITIVLFGKILEIAAFPVPPLTIALLLNIGAVISYMVSPFTGIIMTIAKFVDTTAFNVAVRWNWLFCLLFSVIGILFSMVWGGLFGAHV